MVELPAALKDKRIALVHYWFVNRRGGERVFEELARIFPHADLFAMLTDPDALPPDLSRRGVRTSFLQSLPGVKKHYQKLMLLFPKALESLDLSAYDLVLSHEAGPAKGVVTRAGACHITYSHSPMRYLWNMFEEYRRQAPGGAFGRWFFTMSCRYLRRWDNAAAQRVDHFIASSKNCAGRISTFHGRESHVIYPPVNVSSAVVSRKREDFYLVVSPLVAYKRVDLAIHACNRLQRRLVVIGRGEEMDALRAIAGPNVEFLGYQSDESVQQHYQRCRAFLFPGEEDIGLTPIEAQATGAPVIAYQKGGALETVVGWPAGRAFDPAVHTGIFFDSQSAESLAAAIERFETVAFSADVIRRNAERFDAAIFQKEMVAFIAEKVGSFDALRKGAAC